MPLLKITKTTMNFFLVRKNKSRENVDFVQGRKDFRDKTAIKKHLPLSISKGTNMAQNPYYLNLKSFFLLD
jgi:hypothetical protein